MELSVTDRHALQSLLYAPGYEVLLNLMEAECQIAETQLLQTPPQDHTKIVALHNQAQAMRKFFERFQISVQRAAQSPEPTQPSRQLSPEEIIRLQN